MARPTILLEERRREGYGLVDSSGKGKILNFMQKRVSYVFSDVSASTPNMKKIALALLSVSLLSQLAMADNDSQEGLFDGLAESVLGDKAGEDDADGRPARLTKNFMSQFYAISEDDVTATMVENVGRTAVVEAQTADGEECSFELVQAPVLVNSQYGWLVSSVACN